MAYIQSEGWARKCLDCGNIGTGNNNNGETNYELFSWE